MALPVTRADAQQFRLICAAVLLMPWVVTFLARRAHWFPGSGWLSRGLYAIVGNGRVEPWHAEYELAFPWHRGITHTWAVVLGMAFVAICLTGLHTYWFHPRRISVREQNRAIVLSYYLAAIPMWQWIAAAVIWASEWLVAHPVAVPALELARNAAPLVGFGLLVFCWALYYTNILRLINLLTLPTAGQLLRAALVIPIAWVAAGFVGLGVWPWLVGAIEEWIDVAMR